jgi:hypothetical protein
MLDRASLYTTATLIREIKPSTIRAAAYSLSSIFLATIKGISRIL